MSRNFLLAVIVLLTGMVATVQWHRSLELETYTLILEGDKACMKVLCQRIDERDAHIKALEDSINKYINDEYFTPTR